jgi:putative PIN family toxin of toxin-antitoxin system
VRVFLDANVLVSAVATRGLCADVLQTVVAQHELLVGASVRSQVRRVLRDKFKLPASLIDEFETFLTQYGTLVTTAAPVSVKLRDPTDIPVLGEAVAAKADVLVTGDRDLLELPSPLPVPIASPRGFWELLKAQPREP